MKKNIELLRNIDMYVKRSVEKLRNIELLSNIEILVTSSISKKGKLTRQNYSLKVASLLRSQKYYSSKQNLQKYSEKTSF